MEEAKMGLILVTLTYTNWGCCKKAYQVSWNVWWSHSDRNKWIARFETSSFRKGFFSFIFQFTLNSSRKDLWWSVCSRHASITTCLIPIIQLHERFKKERKNLKSILNVHSNHSEDTVRPPFLVMLHSLTFNFPTWIGIGFIFIT